MPYKSTSKNVLLLLLLLLLLWSILYSFVLIFYTFVDTEMYLCYRAIETPLCLNLFKFLFFRQLLYVLYVVIYYVLFYVVLFLYFQCAC